MDAIDEMNAILAATGLDDFVHEHDEDTEMQDAEEQEQHVEEAPPTMNVIKIDDTQTKINKFVEGPLAPIIDHHYYDSKKHTETKKDWIDLEPGQKKVINLYHIKNDERMISYAVETFKQIHSLVDEETVARLMVVAFNCRDQDGNFIYNEVPEELIDPANLVIAERIKKRTKRVIDSGTTLKVLADFEKEDRHVVRDCLCFIAATYMRMFTKSAENYVKIDKHIRRRFTKFYGWDFPIEDYHPNIESAQAVKNLFELSPIIKSTFYTFLYAGESAEYGEDIKSFLYVTHISYTGLHPLVLFMKCMSAMKVGSNTLANTLHTKAFASELLDICEVIQNLVDLQAGDETRKLRMWRFGRIFNPSFLSTLQTKNCKKLTLVLAYLIGMLSPETNRQVLEIAQIKEASRIEKDVCKAFAQRAHRILISDEFDGNYAGLDKIA